MEEKKPEAEVKPSMFVPVLMADAEKRRDTRIRAFQRSLYELLRYEQFDYCQVDDIVRGTCQKAGFDYPVADLK